MVSSNVWKLQLMALMSFRVQGFYRVQVLQDLRIVGFMGLWHSSVPEAFQP